MLETLLAPHTSVHHALHTDGSRLAVANCDSVRVMLLADITTADSDSLTADSDIMTADSDIMTADSDSLADSLTAVAYSDTVSLVSRERCLSDDDSSVRPLVTMGSSLEGASGLVVEQAWLLGVGGGLYSQPWQGVKVRPSIGIISLSLFFVFCYVFLVLFVTHKKVIPKNN